jgi:parallel beta-helix repeat protein
MTDPRFPRKGNSSAAAPRGVELPLHSLLLFDLSAPEAVEQFRDAACKLLEKEGELSPEVVVQLEEQARSFRVHSVDAADVQREILALPTVLTAFEAVKERKRDGPQLAESIRAAKPESVIVLDRGRYRLTEPLVIRTPIRLLGDGCKRTFLVGEAEGCVLRIETGGAVQVEGVSFEYHCRRPGDAVVVKSGDVELRDCRFAFAVCDPLRERGGRGLVVLSEGNVTVTGCAAEWNEGAGIYVDGRAKPRLEKNQTLKNEGCGIVFADRAEGTAIGNDCVGNREHGIAVRGKAAPNLEGNTCKENRKNGIDFSERARGAAYAENRCEGNRAQGICVSGSAEPSLERNICIDNTGAGIAFYGQAKAEARHNRCLGRHRFGILADRNVEVLLEDNHCASGEKAGIAFLGSARGSAKRNYAEGSPTGILVDGQARPVLEENRCEGNSFAGIWFGPKAGGQASRNHCHGNLYGIFRMPPNRSPLHENSCTGNKAGPYGPV